MKTHLAAVALMIGVTSAYHLQAPKAELTAADLATFLDVQHKVITFDNAPGSEGVSCRLVLLRRGEFVSASTWTGASTSTYSEQYPTSRIAVVYQVEDSSITASIQLDGLSWREELEKPEDIRLNSRMMGLELGDDNRLVLAFDLLPDADGNRATTRKNSSADGASAALVLEVRKP